MPLYKLDVLKSWGAESWTNRYILQAADISAAQLVGGGIMQIERTVHSSSIVFERYRVSDDIQGNDQFIIISVGLPGLAASAATDPLPLFNVVRVDFSVGIGRPSRKYLRTGLTESSVAGQFLTPTYRTSITTGYVTPLLGVDEYVDVDAQPFVQGTVYEPIQMRQLRRGSKRRATPPI